MDQEWHNLISLKLNEYDLLDEVQWPGMGSRGIKKQAYLVKLKFCCMFFEKIVIGDTVASTGTQ